MKHLVKLTYASGWKLTFPINENAPMLFLEWLGEWQTKRRTRLQFSITKKTDDSEVLNDVFVVRFDFAIRETVEECYDYIKNNI